MSDTQDIFTQVTAATSGPLDGDYLWSNGANWNFGVPADGDSISVTNAGDGVDDIATLNVGTLTLSDGANVFVTGSSLDVTSIINPAGGALLEAIGELNPVTVTVGTITQGIGGGGEYGAIGAGAVFVDLSAVDPGDEYFAEQGGFTELSATPNSTSILEYGFNDGASTFALQSPGTTNAFTLQDVSPHDVLELPGSSVSNVGFGSSSMSVTTDLGSYNFGHVGYGIEEPTGFTAAFDSATGLEAITFNGLDGFSHQTAATSGPLDGDYLWSNSANWNVAAPPIDGDSASTSVVSFDDLAALTLAGLTVNDGGSVDVVGASLDVGSAAVDGSSLLEADEIDAGTPVTVTVGTITGGGGQLGASGAGAIFLDQSATDPGETYFAQSGGFTELSAIMNSSSTLEYDGADSTLALQNPGPSNAFALDGVAPTDVLELPGTSVSNVSFGVGSLSITTNDGTYAFSNVTYDDGVPTGHSAASDSTTGLEAITFLCFCKGSLIRTPSGDVPVENLAIGDAVVTWSDEHRPITWIGVGQVLATRGRRNAATPVIVKKGALADNVPHADLRVTKGHSLFIDGALIPVEFLVNHRSILWDDRAQEVSIYHVELASHDIMIANSAPAESYRDDGNRWLFQNANSAWDKKPQAPCAPVLTGGALVDQAWRQLLDRAGPRPGLVLTDDADLHLLVDGKRVDHMRRAGSMYTFCLPASARREDVRIVSRAAAPGELGLARDPRVLGIALRSVIIVAGARHRIIEAADDRLADGFHGHEPELDIRWTNGDATLPAELFEGFDGRIDLMFQVECTTRYIAASDRSAIAA